MNRSTLRIELLVRPALAATLVALSLAPAHAQEAPPGSAAEGQPAAPAQEAPPQEAPPQAPQVFVVAKGNGVPILSMPDKKGPTVLSAEAGQLLRVSGRQRASFLPVELPGGFPVWVHGRNLKPTEEPGVLRVTANAVLQRPLPSTGLESYPLELRLHGGDMLRVIERGDETKPLAEDWVRVWSAPGTFGYVLIEDIDRVTDGALGAQRWTEELGSLGQRTVLAPQAEPGAEPGVEVKPDEDLAARAAQAQQAADMLQAADALLEAERAKATPDFAAVRAAYEDVRALEAGATIELGVRNGLELLGALEAAKALESDLETEKARRAQDILARQRRIWEESRKRDPLIGRYDARGVLERKSRAGEEPRYVLRWGPDLVCEVRCSSGRYDLDLFAGYELGLKGPLAYAVPGALLEERPVLDVSRLEVLGRR